MKKNENTSEWASLRQKAEELLKNKPSTYDSALLEVENLKLIHELQVHQIELEMQNEELRHAWAVAEVANDKYIGLYDLAPFGYFTLSSEGTVIELNISGASMIGSDRQHLKNSQFGFFLSEDTKPTFSLFLEQVFQTKRKESCEVKFVTDSPIPTYVLLSGIIAENQEECNVTAIDITERKKAEQEVNMVSARLALAAKAGGVGIWDYDTVNNILVWDDQMFAIYGVEKENFIGAYEAWLTGIHPDDMERGDAEIRMAIRGEKEFDTEFRVCWPDGSVHYIRAIATVQRDDSGKVFRMIGTNWDITEEKKLEERLKSSESNFRTFFETINDIIVVGDMQGRIIYVNNAVCRKLGYQEEELQGRHVPDLHPAGKRAEAEQIFADMFAGKRDFCPLPLARKDGSALPVETRVWLGKWDGKDCIFGISKDLSQEQEALQKFNKIFDSNPSLMAISSIPEGVFTDVNDAFLTKTGYLKTEVIGKTASELNLFIHPEKQKTAASELENSGIMRDLELQVKTRSGDLLDGLFSGVLLDSQGQKFFLTVMTDITENKQAAQAIRVSEKKYRTMLHASPDAMVLIELNGIITEVSEIGVQLFGADARDDLVNKDIFQFIHASETEKFRKVLATTVNEGLAQNIGLTIKKRNQSVFTGEISATLMKDPDGTPVSILIIIRDISQRKEEEARQMHADRMATLGEMAAGMAHEINQPLNIISMVMDKILFETNKTEMIDVRFLKSKSDKIFENITRIRDIIDHVRDFSRIQGDYIHGTFDVNLSIVNATSMILEQFKHENIDLNLNLEQKIPTIIGNTHKFEQVILNLLANAKDAVLEKKSKQKEDVDMFVGIRSWQENQCICIEVTDNGVGIGKDYIHHVMLPFYTTKEEGKGTGLGLPICYRIMKEMNGTIEISSDISPGTKIKLVVPIQITK